MNKAGLLEWLASPDALQEVRDAVGSLGPLPPHVMAAWSLARIAEQVRACDDPRAGQWASWAMSEPTRTLLQRTLFAFAPDSDPIRPIALELVRARVLQD